MPRVVVDTNVWVSALLNRQGLPARVRAAFEAGKLILVTSEPLLTELARVLRRPRLARKYGIIPADVDQLLALIRRRAEVVPVTGSVRLYRDPDDDVVIETALRGRADMLVTRDDDLKGVSELIEILAAAGVTVLTVRYFLAALERSGASGQGPAG